MDFMRYFWTAGSLVPESRICGFTAKGNANCRCADTVLFRGSWQRRKEKNGSVPLELLRFLDLEQKQAHEAFNTKIL